MSPSLFLKDTLSGTDLKKMEVTELEQLAAEIREYLIQTLAPIGGHLGASLGVVELSIALHVVFSTPEDKIVWDVGHQAYVHKMLTGRLSGMPRIRQYGGLSGFTKRAESKHDAFGAGHASTSISAAYGMAVARGVQEESYHCVAVIGDGALTGGMAFEALNHAGARQDNLLVVLNDNEMSIAPNVGAISAYLARLISGKPYSQVKSGMRRVLEKLPHAYEAAKRVEEHVKGVLMPGTLFEEMGFRYIGPIDGHDFEHLIPTLQNCAELTGPIIFHVLTKKGLGYSPAEKDPQTWHGLGPYCLEKKEPLKSKAIAPSYTSVFSNALLALAEKDKRVVAITAAMPSGTGLEPFAKRFPERYFDVGIAEQHAVTFAAGLCAGGLRPVVAIYSTFIQRAYDQIIHDVCLQKLPVLFCLDRAGVVGADGATHAGIFDIAFLRCIPNLILISPKDEEELQRALCTALSQSLPCAIRYPRGVGTGVKLSTQVEPLPMAKSEVVCEGQDGLVIAVGHCVHEAQEALNTWQQQSEESYALINLLFIKPLDEKTILSFLILDKPLIILEEGMASGGIGQEIACLALKHGFCGYFVHLAIDDVFPHHGTQQEVRRDLRLDRDALLAVLSSQSAA
ncbi:MAG: 1-deoxy-D-xylulose-5-phosphate synthase [Mariprofundaceae bacterium]|nr:1-deoxy-D-xylulose-5-phosphate synthase [Mariprofundaceae bacterium]